MFKRIVFSFIGALVLLGMLGSSVALADRPASQGEPPAAGLQQVMDEGVDWVAVAAKALGLDTDALWASLEDGQSIAEVAQAQGVDPQAVIDAIVAAEKEFVAGLVADGELTQAEADEWLAGLDQVVGDFVQETVGSITMEPAP